jgi:hypothetical protein
MPEKVPPSAIKFYEDRLVTLTRPDDQLALTPYLVGGELPSSTGGIVNLADRGRLFDAPLG